MSKTQLREARMAFLQDTLDFYSEDPKGRRAVGPYGRCKYRDGDRRCAIGRHLTTYKPGMDQGDDADVFNLVSRYPRCLPKGVLDLGVIFLGEVQAVHDGEWYWEEKGLSPKGIARVEALREDITRDRI